MASDTSIKLEPGRLVCGADQIHLTKLEYRILSLLVVRAPSIAETSDLIDACYVDDPDGGPLSARKSVHVTICKLRRKMNPTKWRIITEYGWGYVLRYFPITPE